MQLEIHKLSILLEYGGRGSYVLACNTSVPATNENVASQQLINKAQHPELN